MALFERRHSLYQTLELSHRHPKIYPVMAVIQFQLLYKEVKLLSHWIPFVPLFEMPNVKPFL